MRKGIRVAAVAASSFALLCAGCSFRMEVRKLDTQVVANYSFRQPISVKLSVDEANIAASATR